jgi:hypothetical protein
MNTCKSASHESIMKRSVIVTTKFFQDTGPSHHMSLDRYCIVIINITDSGSEPDPGLRFGEGTVNLIFALFHSVIDALSRIVTIKQCLTLAQNQ